MVLVAVLVVLAAVPVFTATHGHPRQKAMKLALTHNVLQASTMLVWRCIARWQAELGFNATTTALACRQRA